MFQAAMLVKQHSRNASQDTVLKEKVAETWATRAQVPLSTVLLKEQSNQVRR
jgi:hypothetical protein